MGLFIFGEIKKNFGLGKFLFLSCLGLTLEALLPLGIPILISTGDKLLDSHRGDLMS